MLRYWGLGVLRSGVSGSYGRSKGISVFESWGLNVLG